MPPSSKAAAAELGVNDTLAPLSVTVSVPPLSPRASRPSVWDTNNSLDSPRSLTSSPGGSEQWPLTDIESPLEKPQQQLGDDASAGAKSPTSVARMAQSISQQQLVALALGGEVPRTEPGAQGTDVPTEPGAERTKEQVVADDLASTFAAIVSELDAPPPLPGVPEIQEEFLLLNHEHSPRAQSSSATVPILAY